MNFLILGGSRLQIKARHLASMLSWSVVANGLADGICTNGAKNLPCLGLRKFRPFRLLGNAHAMTIAAAFWPRRFPRLPRAIARRFQVEPDTQVLGHCHWQDVPREHPTIILLHGLEGSSDSGYVLGTAEKAWIAGFNIVRLNQRNCGGTENLTETLYHSGLSGDIRSVVLELIERDGLREVFAAGFSMGGNLVLKMAGEFGASAPPEIRGFAAVAPAIDLASCADALERKWNFLYERRFVRGLKRRMRRKASLFPKRYPIDGMREIRTVREFDDLITAPYSGFRNAADYYSRSSANRWIADICKPTLILAAQDDPFVPFSIFKDGAIRGNPHITLVAPEHGGHCGFISERRGEERFWSEARIVEFCEERSAIRSQA